VAQGGFYLGLVHVILADRNAGPFIAGQTSRALDIAHLVAERTISAAAIDDGIGKAARVVDLLNTT
jgi:hypothetical protein